MRSTDEEAEEALVQSSPKVGFEAFEERNKASQNQDPSAAFLIALNSFALAYGLIVATMGMIVLPEEAKRMWPEAHGVSLGVLLGITGVTQLVSPVVGYLSDRCSGRWGRRRPYIVSGGAVAGLGLAMMYVARSLKWRLCYAWSLTVGIIGLNTVYAAYTGLLPDFVPQRVMGKASGVMALMTALGAALGFLLFGFFGVDVSHSYSLYGGTVVSSLVTTVLVAREVPLLHAPPKRMAEVAKAFYISAATHGDFFWVFVIRCFYYMGVSVQCFLLFYLNDVTRVNDLTSAAAAHGQPGGGGSGGEGGGGGAPGASSVAGLLGLAPGEAEQLAGMPAGGGVAGGGSADAPHIDAAQHYVSMIALLGQSSGCVVAVPLGRLSDRWGRKPLIQLSCVCMALVYLSFCLSPPISVVLGLGFIYGIGNGGFMTVDYALAVDVLPNKDEAAKDLGLWGIAAFIGSTIGPLICGPCLHYLGGGAGAGGLSSLGGDAPHAGSTRYATRGYVLIMCIGAAYVVIAALLLRKVRSRR